MVHNAKQKFFLLSCLTCLTSVGLLIGAVATPSWVSYTRTTTLSPLYQGLFKTCQFGSCDSTNGALALSVLKPACSPDPAGLQDRLTVTAGTVLAAAALTGVVVLFQIVHIVRAAKLSEANHMWLAWTLIVAFVSGLIGISVFGGTQNSWLGCGTEYCQAFRNTGSSCGVGYGYIFTIVGVAVILLAATMVITFVKFPHILFPTNDVMGTAVLLEIFAVVLIGVGVRSPEWITVISDYSSIGLFQDCTAWSCTSKPSVGDFKTSTTCTINTTSMNSRFSATAALLIVAAVIELILAILFALSYFRISSKIFLSNTKKRVCITTIIVSLLLQIIGFVLTTNIIDSFYYCGMSFFDIYQGYCRWGIAFGLGLASICLTTLLLVAHFFEFNTWCCFQERFATGRQTFSILKVLRGTKEGPSTLGGQANTPGNQKSKEPAADDDAEQPVRLPSGQWEYDTVSGFYWSEEHYLFFDPSTQQYYDPNKDEWFAQERQVVAQRPLTPTNPVHSSRSAAGLNGSFSNNNISTKLPSPRVGGGASGSTLSRDQLEMVRVNTPRRHKQ